MGQRHGGGTKSEIVRQRDRKRGQHRECETDDQRGRGEREREGGIEIERDGKRYRRRVNGDVAGGENKVQILIWSRYGHLRRRWSATLKQKKRH